MLTRLQQAPVWHQRKSSPPELQPLSERAPLQSWTAMPPMVSRPVSQLRHSTPVSQPLQARLATSPVTLVCLSTPDARRTRFPARPGAAEASPPAVEQQPAPGVPVALLVSPTAKPVCQQPYRAPSLQPRKSPPALPCPSQYQPPMPMTSMRC